MIVHFVIAIFFTLGLSTGRGASTVRTWKYNTNFNNTENWDRRHVPCKTSSVIFPKDMQVPVTLPATKSVLEIKKLVLSRQGWLIFPRTDGALSLSSEERHASCSGGDYKFVRTGSKKWVDPDNWLSPSTFSSKATPHLERIPCRVDSVTFPDESTFSIALPSRPISVARVKMQGQVIKTQSEWSDFLDSFGYEFFPGLLERGVDTFYITGETCDEKVTGCECQNSYLRDEICSDQTKWEEPKCADPVQPIGFCHPICGAFLLSRDGSVPEIRSETEAFLKTYEIVSHTSKANGYVQIVLIEKSEYTGDIKEYANQLHQHLRTKGLVKELASKLYFSGLRTDNFETKIIVERFLLALFISLIGFGAIFCTYEKNWLTRSLNWENWGSHRRGASTETWGFARFENTSGTVEISEEVIPVNIVAPQKPKDTKMGFDNPMFSGSQLPSDGVVLSEFEGRRGSFSTIDTDSGSLADPDSTSQDQLSMKEVNLGPVSQ